jgi:serine/threonine protein kinase
MVGKKNVINLLWVEESRTELVLVFEHCHTTLSSHIEQLSIKYPKRKRQQRIRSNNSRKRVTVRYPLIEENEIRFWMRQLMNGLLLLQEECVVHRDIKPAVSSIPSILTLLESYVTSKG